jgi:hypothetical protein
MPKQMWNEGRVVGASAYEIYVKQHLAVDPNTPPASEREWLASSIAMGSSLLLKIPANPATGDRFIDIQLPHNSSLAAANTIIASFFDGEAHFPIDDQDTDSDTDDMYPWDKYWADRITDYGQLIANNEDYSPNGNITSEDDYSKLPTQSITAWSEHKQKQLVQYMNIIDGIVIQPGNWFTAPNQPPQKDFIPDLSYTHPRVRLHMRGSTSESPLVLLTGFTINSVLAGITGDEGSTNTDHPENGDFLGPTDFPWVAKIVFSVPNAFINYMVTRSYTREIDNYAVHVTDVPIIDMAATAPIDFYNDYIDPSASTNLSKYYSDDPMSDIGDPRYKYWVMEASKAVDTAVLTVYQKNQIFPPALYGNYVVNTGHDNYLSPLDVVAPGTVKMFYNSVDTAKAYESEFPGTHALNLTSDGKLQYFYNNTAVTLAKNSDIPSTSLSTDYLYNADMSSSSSAFNYPGGSLTGTNRPKLLRTYTTDGKSAYSLMFSTGIANAGSDPTVPELTVKPSVGVTLTHSNSNDNVDWTALLRILRNNTSLDLLGDRLKDTKYTLLKPTTPTYNSYSPVASHADDNKLANRWDSSIGASYIEFGNASNPKRLYLLDISDFSSQVYKPDGSVTQEPYYPAYMNFPDDGKDNGPDPTDIPLGSIALGWGWHGVYRLTEGQGKGKHWSPGFGAEFQSGTINGPYEDSVGHEIPGECKHIPFSHGLVIISMHNIDQAPSGEVAVGDYDYVFDKSAQQSIFKTLVVYINQYGGVHTISAAPNLKIDLKIYYHVNSQHVTGVKGISIRNREENNYVNFVIIGDLFNRS